MMEMTEREQLVEQINDLQTQLAFQEDTIAALNQMVAKQQADILELQSQIALIIAEFQRVVSQVDAPSGNVIQERPPHY
ncbi:MAG: SlyX family protein [Cellvibrionales bacterium]|nr:SlyX family protein [Cellvibrionales bacterium]